jgi:alpha-mannosidase
MNVLEPKDLHTIKKCRKIAEGIFGEGWQEKGEKVYEEGDGQGEVTWAIGNCHIDTAW